MRIGGGRGFLSRADVLEYFLDDVGVFDTSDHAQFAAAFEARFDVDGKHAFQTLHPGHGGEGLVRLFFFGFASGHDTGAVFTVGGEYAVETGEVQARAGYECGQTGDKVQRVQHDVGGAVAEGLFDLNCPIPQIRRLYDIAKENAPSKTRSGHSRAWVKRLLSAEGVRK